ncbi:MAG: radical SAM protein [Candidatus Diapherotrites archaeon]|nr:radical SAM protein [Candidatus Diapherotrites archaeon]
MVLLCNYYLTYDCNLKCDFCNVWRQRIERKKLHKISDIESNLDDLKRLGVRIIDFTGGEPLLYPYVIEALHAAKQRGFFTTLATNGVLYPRFARQLKGKVNVLLLSLHSFGAAEKALKAAKRVKQKVFLLFVVTDKNIGSLPDVCSFALQNRVPVRLAPCSSYFGNKGLGKKNIKAIYDALEKPFVHADLSELEVVKAGGNSVKKPICRAVSNAVTISPDNRLLLPCYHHAKEKIEIKKDLFDIYNSPKVEQFKKKEGLFDFCDGCTIYCYLRTGFHSNPFSKLFWLRAVFLTQFAVEYLRNNVSNCVKMLKE